ncbi:glycerol acyltransferase [Chelativorans sp. ZYF759]|uniref:lysophospholipid acyltransferase family protein n=1 Tax=Chelativorans sp. ZYF759 TaxID=2692213 RepID=UPI00145E0C9D|nr:lysophospholipid acyltransferase family protein [Chelativorans sp. ZYF759]NMG39999.1 glycerol acyltransferase [Chelativorans sp. ZYF759]
MLVPFKTRRRFPELSYANDSQPPAVRAFIRGVEALAGRDRFAGLYEQWRSEIFPTGERVFARMLELIDLKVRRTGACAVPAPGDPLVIVANHPFGIGDGIAVLSLAESLGRPFRVMIHADLLRVSEMADYALPVDFSETRDAIKRNMAVRHEALKLLREGVTIVVFPAGGVATAPRGFGPAEDLPWKLFPARLIQEGKAAVLPVHFRGQNGALFHLASRLSPTVRTSLLIHEFAKLSGKTIDMHIGRIMEQEELAAFRDRNELIGHLRQAVFALDTGERLTAARRWLPPRWPAPRRIDRGSAPG